MVYRAKRVMEFNALLHYSMGKSENIIKIAEAVF